MPQVSLTGPEAATERILRDGLAWNARVLWKAIPSAAYHNLSVQGVALALTRICNADCVFCPYQFETRAEKLHMSDWMFEKLLRDIQEAGIAEVMLSPDLGEPTLAPNFLQKVRRLRESGVRLIELTTNGTLLHKIQFRAMLEFGPDKINISFAGFDKAMYERLYRVPLYDQTRFNILSLLRENRALGRPRAIQLWLRGDRPAEELLQAPEMAEVRALADEICIMTEVDGWNGLIRQEMLPEGMKLQLRVAPLTRRPCMEVFELAIHPDGDIHVCPCRNILRDPKLHIGNARHMSIREAHRKILEIARRWEGGLFPELCKRCYMYSDPATALPGRIRRTLSRKLLRRFWF